MNCRKKRKNLARRTDWCIAATISEEAVAHDFGLLLKAVILEPPAWLQCVMIFAEGVAH